MTEENQNEGFGTRLLNKKEAAKFLNISVGTLDHLKTEGEIAFVKIRGIYRFDIEDLDKFIENNKLITKAYQRTYDRKPTYTLPPGPLTEEKILANPGSRDVLDVLAELNAKHAREEDPEVFNKVLKEFKIQSPVELNSEEERQKFFRHFRKYVRDIKKAKEKAEQKVSP